MLGRNKKLQSFAFKRNLKKIFPIIFLFAFLVTLLILAEFYFSGFAKDFFFPKIVSPLASKKNYSAGSVEYYLDKANIKFESVKIASNSSYLVLLQGKEQILISGKKNIQSQITSLQLILSRLTIEGKKFKRLDLRFDKPLIEF